MQRLQLLSVLLCDLRGLLQSDLWQLLQWTSQKLNSCRIHTNARSYSIHLSGSVYFIYPVQANRNNWCYMRGEAWAPQLCVIDLASLRALRLQRTWNWTVPCSPTGILITLCQYCSKPVWQTRGTQADNRLSKQVHITVIAHCSLSMALIGFAHRSTSEPYPEHLLLSCEDCTLTQW